jgi:hypothetical protein
MIGRAAQASPQELCDRIMGRVSTFATAGPPPDDRTLMVVKFRPAWDALSHLESPRESELLAMEAAS